MTIKSPGPSGAFAFRESQGQCTVKSEYRQTGEWFRQRQRSDVAMDTEMRTLDDDPDYAEAKRQRRKTKNTAATIPTVA